MKLTICLVTKGREEYLTEALKSYESFLSAGEVEIVIIDNGSDIISRNILCDWKMKHDSQVHYHRCENNEKLGIPYFWKVIGLFQPEWILFPGDDDILVFEIFDQWKKSLKKNGSLNAFAASGQVVNSKGDVTGEIRSPATLGALSEIEKTAQALFEPPFFWPCLFMKYTAVPESVINSRFVFDWWVGLQLVLSGSIETSKHIGLKYRVHKGQESFQASSRRKHFEGFNMISSVIDSESFNSFLERLTDAELSVFFNLCIEKKLLYAQPEYTVALLNYLAIKVIKYAKSNLVKTEIAEKYLSGIGIYTKKYDLETIFNRLELPHKESLGNIAVVFSENTCGSLTRAGKYFRNEGYKVLTVGCMHSIFNSEQIQISCKVMRQFDEKDVADQILVAFDEIAENQGVLNFTVTPFEKELIAIYRSLKISMPGFIRRYLFRFKTIILRNK
jgi:glycosyltransferase involved in cell wall biosynthesis